MKKKRIYIFSILIILTLGFVLAESQTLRLPVIGGDGGSWGQILNDFLKISHNDDGTLKNHNSENLPNYMPNVINVMDSYPKANEWGLVDNNNQNIQINSHNVVYDNGKFFEKYWDSGQNKNIFLEIKNNNDLVIIKSKIILLPGAKGDGESDDTLSIQNAIDVSLQGSTIYFPKGIYIISDMIKYKGGRSYVGEGVGFTAEYMIDNGYSIGAVIKQKDNANIISNQGSLAGLFVDERWYFNSQWNDDPVRIINIAFDGNKDKNPSSTACGVIIRSWSSSITDCIIRDTSKHGLFITTSTQDQPVRNDWFVDTRIERNWISNTGGNGIYADHNTDGYLLYNQVAESSENGIYVNYAAGWLIEGNHIWTIKKDAIKIGEGVFTKIINNQIEDFGREHLSNKNYSGIDAQTEFAPGNSGGNGGTIISGNHISRRDTDSSFPNPLPSGISLRYIHSFTAGSNDANVVLTNNVIESRTQDNAEVGLLIESMGNGKQRATIQGNVIGGFALNKAYSISPGQITIPTISKISEFNLIV